MDLLGWRTSLTISSAALGFLVLSLASPVSAILFPFSLIPPFGSHSSNRRRHITHAADSSFFPFFFAFVSLHSSPSVHSHSSCPLLYIYPSSRKPQKTINIIAREAGDGPGRSSGKHLVIFLNQLLVCFFLVLTARLWGERRAVGILHCCEEEEGGGGLFHPFFHLLSFFPHAQSRLVHAYIHTQQQQQQREMPDRSVTDATEYYSM